MTNIETIKAAGALVAYPRTGSGAPDGVLVYGETKDVRRAAAALGFSFERLSEKVTRLTDEFGYVDDMCGNEERSSFRIYVSTATRLGLLTR